MKYLFTLLLVYSTGVLANPWGLPESEPWGLRAVATLDVLKSADEAAVQTYIDEHFADNLLNLRESQKLDDFVLSLSQLLGAFELVGLDIPGESTVLLDMQSSASDKIYRLELRLEDEEPHRISYFDALPIMPAVAITFEGYPQLEETLRKLEADNLFSGKVLIVDQGRAVFDQAYGYASKKYQVKNTNQTRFNLGSLNKSFTGAAALLLAQQGKLDLDAPVSRYLSDWPQDKAAITVRMLLQHRSGLGEYWNQPEYLQSGVSFNRIDQYLDIIRDLPVAFEAGSQQMYSNAGYEVLGAIIEAISGEDYYAFIRQQVFLPLGMPATDNYDLTLSEPDIATGYTNLSPAGPDSGFARENTHIMHTRGSASGGAYGTAQDVLKFYRAMRNGRLLNQEYTRLYLNGYQALSPQQWAEWSPHNVEGFFGGAPGLNAAILLDYENDFQVIILSNYDERMAEDLASSLFEQIRNQRFGTVPPE